MRIVLLYPPPWKIPGPNEPPDPQDGPPPGFHGEDLDSDFCQTPYGLLSLAAQARRAGFPVKIFNLSSFPWSQVEEILTHLDADLYGLSAWTANRRGVALVAQTIKRLHPDRHLVVGGPHATPLAREMLEHIPAIDTISLGESEQQFLELAQRLAAKASVQGIPGTAYRDGPSVVLAPAQPPIRDLDALASPHDDFDTHIVMTSRGCAWHCTFCGAETTWGRGFRALSVAAVLDTLEKAVRRVGVKMLQVKDDTFTTNQQRALQICRGIRERKIKFAWSCDTRVDVLNEELVREMRLAGCERMSLGVESGSPKVLRAINKKVTIDQILASTALIKKYGIQARYYMMLGNRGETAATFQESLAFLERAKPDQYIFSCLSIYPGTQDFRDAEAAGWFDRELFFTGKFQEFKCPFDAPAEDTQLMNSWFQRNRGIRVCHQTTREEAHQILGRLGEHPSAHLNLAIACYQESQWAEAEGHAQAALSLEHPLPGLVRNLLACIAYQKGDISGLQREFLAAARSDPQHPALIQNVQAARTWFKSQGPERGVPLPLQVHSNFELLERTVQPALPGPLPPNYADWDA